MPKRTEAVETAHPHRSDDRHAESEPETVTGGGWTSIAEEMAAPQARPPVGGLGGFLHRLTDPQARQSLFRNLRDRLAVTMEAFRHPPMTGAMPSATPAGGPPPSILPRALSEPDQPPPFDGETALARLESALRQLPERGLVTIPANLQSLDRLLSDPPPSLDFEAVDLLHDCFPRGTRHSANRVLLAVARNLTRNFGQPGRLPMASGKAWTMLDPAVFADQMAAQLAEINAFIRKWQVEEKSFLILEFAEVELIEYMFEHLHPRRHGALLVQVMDFKVLSARRVGLLRRIPARVRRVVQHMAGADPAAPLAYARDCIVMLEAIERTAGFHLVSEAAAIARNEIEKIAERLTQQAPPPPMPGPAAVAPLPPQPEASGPPPERPAPSPQPISSVPLPMIPPQSLGVDGTQAPLPRMAPPPAVPHKRFTNKEKTAAVMRVFQGEDRDWVAISIGAPPEMLTSWQDSFLNGAAAALAPKAKEPKKARAKVEEASIDELKAKLQALLQTVEVLSTQIQSVPGTPPEHPEPPPRPKRARKPPKR